MKLFGINITRNDIRPGEKSFVAPPDEGSVDTIQAGGHYGTYLDMDAAVKSEAELVKKYRDISFHSDVDMAIEDIINEAFANLDDEDPLKIDLDKLKAPEKVKTAINAEFATILEILQFKTKAHDFFRRWYIDGKLYFHKVVDEAKPSDGIKDIRYIDPRKIKKVRQVFKKKDPKSNISIIEKIEEFFVYNEQGIWATRVTPHIAQQATRIEKDSIAYCSSGVVDADNGLVLSHLHKAIKPANQLRMMENALLIYRLARAPERRIFYVDVGNLPRIKAEQYLKDIMNRYRNKTVYDSSTGELRDDKKFMSMLEDFWLPRREGSKGTEITTLPGGDNLGKIDDINFFQKRLYQSLNVPVSRLAEDSGGFNLGKEAEINRDELKFTKFINRLRQKFAMLFLDLLKTQLIMKNIITAEDWGTYRDKIQFIFASDTYYEEAKEQELLRSRFELLASANDYVGVYVSKAFIQKKILRLTEDEITKMNDEIEEEVEGGFVAPSVSDVQNMPLPEPEETKSSKK